MKLGSDLLQRYLMFVCKDQATRGEFEIACRNGLGNVLLYDRIQIEKGEELEDSGFSGLSGDEIATAYSVQAAVVMWYPLDDSDNQHWEIQCFEDFEAAQLYFLGLRQGHEA